jgi:hypothetical protein
VLVGLTGPVFTVCWWFFVTVPGIVPIPGEPLPYWIHQVIFASLTLTFPLSIAFSILRYRLWDIDILIRRTLVYTLLTAVLGLVYLGSVVLLQAVVRTFTGGTESSLVTVISTLAIAALFLPLRQRIQALIDRRFYRRSYDAARALEAFGQAARDDVDLNVLGERLLAVVEETMQPDHVSLWLRSEGDKATR